MKLTDHFPIYELGAELGHLKDIGQREVTSAFEQMFALFRARQLLERLVTGAIINLDYCAAAANDLLEAVEGLEKDIVPNEAGDFNPLESWRFRGVRSKIEKFEHQLAAELRKMATYTVPKRGIFDTELLVDFAERHFAPAILATIGEMSVNEFKASGRCLAFGLFSASGYHAMRATESVLRQYYELFKGASERELTMGQMASQLDDLAKSSKDRKKPAARTASALKDIASFDRNPVMHPTAVLDEQDALSLFSRAQGAIIDMARELIDHGDAHTQNDMLLDSPRPSNAMAAGRASKKSASATEGA